MSAVAPPSSTKKAKTYPVVEVFGPTIQGEGWVAGLPTYFVRFGGCDYRCSWCDSLHAVLPTLVRENATKLTAGQIDRILGEPLQAEWVTLSGGNPAMLDLGPLVTRFHRRGLKVAVETQGSRFKPWLAKVDHLTVSPKPPSSGEATERNAKAFAEFMDDLAISRRPDATRYSLKVVAFDEQDLAFALEVARSYPTIPFFVSVGTDSIGKEPLAATADRYRELCEALAVDGSAEAKRARILPQLHVVAWGHRLGV